MFSPMVERTNPDVLTVRHEGKAEGYEQPDDGRDGPGAVGVADRIVEAARAILLPDESHVTISVGVSHVDAAHASDIIESVSRQLKTCFISFLSACHRFE